MHTVHCIVPDLSTYPTVIQQETSRLPHFPRGRSSAVMPSASQSQSQSQPRSRSQSQPPSFCQVGRDEAPSTPLKQKRPPLDRSSKSHIPVLSPKARPPLSPSQSSGSGIPLQCPYSPTKDDETDMRLRLLSLLQGSSTSSSTEDRRGRIKTFADARMKLSPSRDDSPMSTPGGRRKQSRIPKLRRPGDGKQSPLKSGEPRTHGDKIDMLRPVTRSGSRAKSTDRRARRDEDSSFDQDHSTLSNDVSSTRLPSVSLEALSEITAKNKDEWSRELPSVKSPENASPIRQKSEYGSPPFLLRSDEPPSDDDITQSGKFLKSLPKNPAIRNWTLHAMRNIRRAAIMSPTKKHENEENLRTVETEKVAEPDMTPFFKDSDSSSSGEDDSEKENVPPDEVTWSDDSDDDEFSERSLHSLFNDSLEPGDISDIAESSPLDSYNEYRNRRVITPNKPPNFESVPPRRKKTRQDSTSSLPSKDREEEFDATQPFEIVEDEEEVFYTPEQDHDNKDRSDDDDERKALSPLVTSERGKNGRKRAQWPGYFDEDLFQNGEPNADFGAGTIYGRKREPLEEIGAVPFPRFQIGADEETR